MTVRIPPTSPKTQSSVYTIDFRETAPALANATMFSNNPMASKWGGLSVAVPGEVLGLAEAHRRWGNLPWKEIVQPSVELARGWTVDRELGVRIPVSSRTSFRFLRRDILRMAALPLVACGTLAI
jgi:gamma-glutamyltranspeptidase/glutathione hydrolase/leukotriene-C4 hydrolase